MKLLYCGDRGIEDGVLISTLSIARFVSTLDIHLITFDYQNKYRHFAPITEHFATGLEALLNEQCPSKVHLHDASELVRACPPTANEDSRFTPGCMLRLYADEISDIPDEIIYLDNDVVALRDPSALEDINLAGHELAGVLDNYGSHFFQRHGHDKEYLNSGVLLLNMALIRETGLFRRARLLCHDEKMFMPDQTALNKLCHTKFFLDRRYNEQGKTRPDTVFRHFTTTFQPWPYPHPQTIKPWHISALHDKLKEHSFDDVLDIYQQKIKELKDE